MSTPPRLDDNYRSFSIPESEPSPLDTERMRAVLAQWAEEDRRESVRARRDAIICAILAMSLLGFCYAYGVSLTEVPSWLVIK